MAVYFFSTLAGVLALVSLWTSNPRLSVGIVALANLSAAASYACAPSGVATSGIAISLAASMRQGGVLLVTSAWARRIVTALGAIVGVAIMAHSFEPVGSSLATTAFLCSCIYSYCTKRRTQRLWGLPGNLCLGAIAAISQLWPIVAINVLAVGINLHGLAKGR